MHDHRRKLFVEIHVKDDSTQELKKQIASLTARNQELQEKLGRYNTQAAVDITDLRLAIKHMKSIGANETRIRRLEEFLARYIQSVSGR